jgi:hypothetical protein
VSDSDADILRAGFCAALRWLYEPMAEDVRKDRLPTDHRYSDEYLTDLAAVLRARRLLDRGTDRDD